MISSIDNFDKHEIPEIDTRQIINLSNSLIDNKSNVEERDRFQIIEHKYEEVDLAKSSWIRDELVSNCSICGSGFNMFRRKHHCRCCGKIFCYDCTKYSVEIPNLEKCFEILTKKREKVCLLCYKKIIDFNHLKKMYIVITNLPVTIPNIIQLSMVSKIWKKIIQYYLTILNKCLQKPITEKLTDKETNLIWLNRSLFSGHSSWLIQLIKVISLKIKDTTNAFLLLTYKTELLRILAESRQVDCHRIVCNSECYNCLKTEDAILCMSNLVLPAEIENYIMDIIVKGTIDEILCYLPVIVNSLKQTSCKNSIQDYLLSIAKKNYEFANFLFWEFTLQMENIGYKNIYNLMRCNFTENIKTDTKNNLQTSFYMVENIVEMSKDIKNFSKLLDSYLLENSGSHIYSPLNPYILCERVCLDGIKVKGSSSRPICIKFITNQNTEYEVLYKNDDVRKDLITMNIIKLIDIILKREEGLDLNIVKYNVLPISYKSGFIEIVKNAETILAINKRHHFSILNFILEHNPTKSVDEIREKFTRSCVAYCILSYLLGIGDRHMENIMVKQSGEIFHIDFGFILGSDPKPMAPEIRITDEMIDAMGGLESKYYHNFKELCARSFICLRRHVSIFRVMFSCFYNANPIIDKRLTKDYIDKFINNKFLVGEDVNNAKLYLINKISTRSMGYSETLIDLCHQAQDSKSNISNLTNSALSLGSSLMGYIWNS